MLTIRLNKGEERRLRTGHLWIFSNEIGAVEGDYEPGAVAEVSSASGRFLGVGTYNRSSLIACRLFTRRRQELGAPFFARRLAKALELRKAWYPDETAYRLAFSEGDLLPGFIADRYGDHVVVQASTAGAQALLEPFLDGLSSLLEPRVVVLRNDAPARALEGLDSHTAIARGEVTGPVEFTCDGLRYRVDLLAGQKTGFYFDHRENRLAAAKLTAGRRVLDAFSYTGSWALTAARAGARTVTAVDSSEPALETARANAALNGVEGQIEFLRSDVPEFLERARKEGRKYDVIFLDPPAFARSKKDLREALGAYERLNRRALELLEDGGYLVTSSCSFHVSPEDLSHALARAAAPLGRTLRLIEWRGQAKDHPGILAMPETRYLKCAILQVV